MKTIRTLFALLLLLLLAPTITSELKAQDVHFSQNYATPLYLNPAMTGLMSGDLRASVVYRNQMNSAMQGQPFRTIYASADMAFQALRNKNRFSVGLLLYNDQAGSLSFNTNYVDLSIAYNLAVSETAYVSIGLEGGIAQRGFDASKAILGDQHDGNGGISTEPSTDVALLNSSHLRGNLAGGAMVYIAPTTRNSLYAGGALFHITSPDLSFSNADEGTDKLYSKISAQAGGSVAIANKIDIVPSIYFIKQAAAYKLDAGSFIRFIFNIDRHTQLSRAINFGSWIRMANSIDGAGLNTIVLATKFDYDNLSLGLSYDINLGDLGQTTYNRGGIEISLVYTALVRPKSSPLYCPKF